MDIEISGGSQASPKKRGVAMVPTELNSLAVPGDNKIKRNKELREGHPPMQSSITLYDLAGADADVRFSPHCWKVLMALAHKGLTAKRIPVRFAEKDTLAFSGQALLPVLVDSGHPVADSWRIAEYLESRFMEAPSLFGGSAAMANARFVNSWTDTALLSAIARVILMDVFNGLDDRDRSYFRASREKIFGMPLESVVADQPARLADLRRSLQPLRQMLKKQEFIAGDAPAYVDYSVFGMFMWARCTRQADILQSDDAVAVWRDKLLDAFGGLARCAPRSQ